MAPWQTNKGFYKVPNQGWGSIDQLIGKGQAPRQQAAFVVEPLASGRQTCVAIKQMRHLKSRYKDVSRFKFVSLPI